MARETTQADVAHAGATGGYAIGAALLLTAFRTFYFDLPDYAVSYLAVPIATEVAAPGTYPASDILVQSGLHSGFHLYVALGKLAALGIPATLSWAVGLLVSLVWLAWLVFVLVQFLTDDRAAAALAATVIMAMSSFRGTLAFSPAPSSEFMTAAIAVDLVLLVLLSGWQRRWLVAGFTAGVLCDIHPSFGSIALLLLFASSVLYWAEDRRWIVRAWALGIVVALPNAVAMFRHLFGDTRAEATGASFLALIAPFQPQNSLFRFPTDEFGMYSGLLVLALAAMRPMSRHRRRLLLAALGALHGLMLLYVVGVEVLQSAFIGFFFWLRATALVKLLVVPLCCVFAVREWRARRPVGYRALMILALGGAAFVQNSAIAESLLLSAIAAVCWRRSAPWPRVVAASLGVLAVVSVGAVGWRRLGIPVAEPELRLWLGWLRGVLPLVAMPLAWRAADGEEVPPAAALSGWRWHAVLGALLAVSVVLRHPYDLSARTLLPFAPGALRHRIALDEPAGALSGVAQWARRDAPRDALFVLPPELRESEQFRTRAERGVFVTIGDLAQLTYSPRVFAEARRRAELAGVRIVQGEPDAAGYDRLATDGLTALQRAGATHVVLRRSAAAAAFPVVYSDARWVVHDVRR